MYTPQESRGGPQFPATVSAMPSFGRSAVSAAHGDGVAGESAAPAAAGRAEKLGRWLARWWSRTPDGRTYRRRRSDALLAAVGLGVVVACGVLVANRTLAGTDVAVFQRIDHWPLR